MHSFWLPLVRGGCRGWPPAARLKRLVLVLEVVVELRFENEIAAPNFNKAAGFAHHARCGNVAAAKQLCNLRGREKAVAVDRATALWKLTDWGHDKLLCVRPPPDASAGKLEASRAGPFVFFGGGVAKERWCSGPSASRNQRSPG